MKPALLKNRVGSTLLAVLAMLTILTILAGSTMLNITNRQATLNQANAWEQALVAAEAGIHQAMAQLEKQINTNSALTSGTYIITLKHTGEGATTTTTTYVLTGTTLASSPYPIFHVRSTGRVNIPGAKTLSKDPRDIVLRKLRLTGTNNSASRTLEAWLQPQLNTSTAIATDEGMNFNNHTIVIDSFDSSEASRTDGLPPRNINGQPGTLGQFNANPYYIYEADLATNGTSGINAGNATVYGDVYTNGGDVIQTAGVFGSVYSDYYEPLAPVFTPSWASKTPTARVNGATTYTGGPKSSPTRINLATISLAGNKDILNFAPGANSTTDTYVEAYVSGNVTTRGGGIASLESGSINIQPGMHVTFYVGGSLNLSGNGMINQGKNANAVSFYGISANGQNWDIGGTSTFFGTVYAPEALVSLSGGGNGTYVGSIVARYAELNGSVQLRYDENLAKEGLLIGYKIAGWFEDTRGAL